MERWHRDLNSAAVGIILASGVELLSGAWGESEAKPLPRLGRILVAGAVAVAYTRLVPPSQWGARSAYHFAQSAPVVRIHASTAPISRLRLGIWGGLTGLLLHRLQAAA